MAKPVAVIVKIFMIEGLVLAVQRILVGTPGSMNEQALQEGNV